MNGIELTGINTSSANNDLPLRRSSALPPTDEGSQAWLCLGGCFLANVLIWGFALSFGILQSYYETHEPFSSAPNGIAAIGTTATGLMYLVMPLYFAVFQRWPRTRIWSTWLSLPSLAAALGGASFANSIGHLILCQGVLYALAGNALVTPTITYLDEWFVRRKGLAVGIMWAGDGAGGVLMPLLLDFLLAKWGFRWTLRFIGCLMIIMITPALFFLKPRLPVSSNHISRPVDTTFMKTPLFWTLQLFNIAQAFGAFLPNNYLPTFAESLGINSTLSSVTLIIVNVSACLGCITTGALVDRFDITNILLGISICASVTVFLVWGFSMSLPPLLLFCILYGLTAGSYSTCWGGMVKEIQRKHPGVDATIIFGLLAAGRGIGSVISGPLSESLISRGALVGSNAMSAYDSEYGPLVVFSGCTGLVGGGSWVFRKAGLI